MDLSVLCLQLCVCVSVCACVCDTEIPTFYFYYQHILFWLTAVIWSFSLIYPFFGFLDCCFSNKPVAAAAFQLSNINLLFAYFVIILGIIFSDFICFEISCQLICSLKSIPVAAPHIFLHVFFRPLLSACDSLDSIIFCPPLEALYLSHSLS